MADSIVVRGSRREVAVVVVEIESFASAMGQAARASRNTVAGYTRDLKDFRRYLVENSRSALRNKGPEVDPDKISADHVRNYLAALMRSASKATLQRRL